MIEGWREVALIDIIEKFIDYRGKTPTKTSSGVPLITAKIVKAGRILPPTEYISEEEYKIRMTRGFPQKNDVVLTTEAPLGEVALIKKERVSPGQRLITIRGYADVVSNVFLKYFFQSDIGQYELYSRASGTTVFGIKVSELRQIPVTLPPLEEQKAIAGVLSCLDDKIDLLHRQNATLENLAQTIFRQTFIENASEDWEEFNLLDIIKLIGGGTPKTTEEEYWDGDILWLSGKDIAAAHKSIIQGSDKKITKLGLEKSSAKLLPALSTVISARGTVGKYALIPSPMTFSQSNYGIISKTDDALNFFIYLLIDHSVNELQSYAYGSVFDTITTKTFSDINLRLPKKKIWIEFEENIKPIFEKKINNSFQIQTLEKQRDTLLPKLISGEVRVK